MIPKGGIAFFDSGIGGLTVLETCRKRLQGELFYYYGDNAYAPYGNRSEKEIFRRVKKAMRLFRRLRVQAVVFACNTVTAVCVDELRKKYSFPIIGAEPAVQLAAKDGGEIFILTTRATYQSHRFEKLLSETSKKYPQAKLLAFACDGLAGAIEKNIYNAAFDYAPYLPDGKPNVVVLGCTHYVYIKQLAGKKYQCKVVDGNEGIARRLTEILKNNKNIRAHTCKKPKKSFLRPFITTKAKRCKEVNKYSPKNGKKNPKKDEGANVIFLGKSKGFKEKAYKKMFDFTKNGHKSVFGGQKIKKN